MVRPGRRKRQVVIQVISHGSVSEKAGMPKRRYHPLPRRNVGGRALRRYELSFLFKKKGDRVKVSAAEERFGPRQVKPLEFEILPSLTGLKKRC